MLEHLILTEETNASSLYELTDRGVAYLAGPQAVAA